MEKRIASTIMALGFVLGLAWITHAASLPVSGVTASGHQNSNVPENMLDGDLSTRWSYEQIGAEAIFELTDCETVAAVKIAWYKGNERAARFTLETSEDGTAWAPAFDGASSGETVGLETYAIEPRVACFVRLVGLGNPSNDFTSITEVEIHSVGGDVFPPAPGCLDISGLPIEDQALIEALVMRLTP